MITLHGFGKVHPAVHGFTRDLRALWALEETGLAYRVHGLDHTQGENHTAAYREISPFEQLPVLDDEGFILSESGAIVLYLAEKSGRLIPGDAKGRADVTRWCFAALTTVEPVLAQLSAMQLFPDPTEQERLPGLLKLAHRYFSFLDLRLRTSPFIAGAEFTVADILLTTVLRHVRKRPLLNDHPVLRAYQEKCEARPLWSKVLNDYEHRLGSVPGVTR